MILTAALALSARDEGAPAAHSGVRIVTGRTAASAAPAVAAPSAVQVATETPPLPVAAPAERVILPTDLRAIEGRADRTGPPTAANEGIGGDPAARPLDGDILPPP